MIRRAAARRALGSIGLVGVLLSLAWWLAAGCKEGQGPTAHPNPDGPPGGYLPPGNVVFGTTRTLGRFYNYDQSKFRLYKAEPAADSKFVRSESTLAIAGATLAQRLRPDTTDAELARVYNDPRLFGFVASTDSIGEFLAGPLVQHSEEFLPLNSLGGETKWRYNHNGFEWTRVDSLAGPVASETARGRTVYRIVSTNLASPELKRYYKPSPYSAELLISNETGSDPQSSGAFLHGWTLVAERVVDPRDRDPGVRDPDRMRNPRFLWLSIGSTPFAAVDQCLDGVPSHLRFDPVKLWGEDLRVGEIFSTYTYLAVDSSDVRRRLNESARLGNFGPCGGEIVVGRDTLRIFPTKSYELLTRFEVRVERFFDQLVLTGGQAGPTAVVGRYGPADQVVDVVKLSLSMYLYGVTGADRAQYIEIYYQRHIGEVVRGTGADVTTRSRTRLIECIINGVQHPRTEFAYQD